MIRLDMKKIMTQWGELLAPADGKVVSLWNCFHLRRSVAAWDGDVSGYIFAKAFGMLWVVFL